MATAIKPLNHSVIRLTLNQREHEDILVALNLACIPKYKTVEAKLYVQRLRKIYDEIFKPEQLKAIKRDKKGKITNG